MDQVLILVSGNNMKLKVWVLENIYELDKIKNISYNKKFDHMERSENI